MRHTVPARPGGRVPEWVWRAAPSRCRSVGSLKSHSETQSFLESDMWSGIRSVESVWNPPLSQTLRLGA